jgi:hemerythrin superfamily protein
MTVEETRELHVDKDGTLTYANASEMLQDDHSRIREFFQEYEKAEDNTVKRRIAQDALLELDVHTALEEELIYPAMRAQDTFATDQAVENHHILKIIMAELKNMIPGAPHFDAKFRVMAQIALRHFDEEEAEILPEVADQLLDLCRLGDQMSLLRQRLIEQAALPFERSFGTTGSPDGLTK